MLGELPQEVCVRNFLEFSQIPIPLHREPNMRVFRLSMFAKCLMYPSQTSALRLLLGKNNRYGSSKLIELANLHGKTQAALSLGRFVIEHTNRGTSSGYKVGLFETDMVDPEKLPPGLLEKDGLMAKAKSIDLMMKDLVGESNQGKIRDIKLKPGITKRLTEFGVLLDSPNEDSLLFHPTIEPNEDLSRLRLQGALVAVSRNVAKELVEVA